jgi:hypothetical protein
MDYLFHITLSGGLKSPSGRRGKFNPTYVEEFRMGSL